MPTFRDITVHVTTSDGQEIKEWGVQTLRKHNKISAYIQSETDVSFHISVQPKIPFVAPDVSSAHCYETRRRGTDRPGFFRMDDEWNDVDDDYESPGIHSRHHGGQQGHHESNPSDDSFSRRMKREPRDEPSCFSSPLHSRDFQQTPPPPFHFLASLYLDGRQKAERKVIVYLDPDDEDFNYPDGQVNLKTRWVQGEDGTLKELAWVFKDVGIETIFDKMLIAGERQSSRAIFKREEKTIMAAMNTASQDSAADVRHDEDTVLTAMKSTSLNAVEDLKSEEKCRVGQIQVVLERIKLGEKWADNKFRAKHKQSEMEDVNMTGTSSNITHTAGFLNGRTIKAESVRVAAYTMFKESEGPYATFTFFYRSQKNLEKFDFPGFPRSSRKLRGRRELKANFSMVTPLSISKPPAPLKKRNSPGFEEQVKKNPGFKSTTPEFKFNASFRTKAPKVRKDQVKLPRRISRLFDSSDAESEESPAVSIFDTPPGVSTQLLQPGTSPSVEELSPITAASLRRIAATTLNFSTINGNTPLAYRFHSSSDADNEDEESSDMETHLGSTSEADSNGYRPDGDDQSLHTHLNKVSIGQKRSRNPTDHDKNGHDLEAQDSDQAGPSKKRANKAAGFEQNTFSGSVDNAIADTEDLKEGELREEVEQDSTHSLQAKTDGEEATKQIGSIDQIG